MKRHRIIAQRRSLRTAIRRRRLNAFELLQAGLETPDEATWYAQRLELLGRAMFGELWDSDKADNAFSTPHPALTSSQCAAPHPTFGHLLPKAEKEFSPVEAERVTKL